VDVVDKISMRKESVRRNKATMRGEMVPEHLQFNGLSINCCGFLL
jgi:hypothetical protein